MGDEVRQQLRWPCTHCSVALETRTSTLSSRAARAQVGQFHLDPGMRGARRGDHLRTRVHTAHGRARPPFGQQCGESAGPATEIDDRPRILGRHPGEQVDERACSLVREGQVALRIPGREVWAPSDLLGERLGIFVVRRYSASARNRGRGTLLFGSIFHRSRCCT